VVKSNVRGRELGSFVKEVQANIARKVKLPTGYWLSMAVDSTLLIRSDGLLAFDWLRSAATISDDRDRRIDHVHTFDAISLAIRLGIRKQKTGQRCDLWLRDTRPTLR